MVIITLLLFFLALMASAQTVSQNAQKSYTLKWTHEPFDQNVFIENKGQFDGQDNLPGSDIRYFVGKDGVLMYFTPQGVTYREDERAQPTDNEIEEAEKQGKDADKVLGKLITHCVNMQWLGADPNAEIISEQEVEHYYTYPDLKDKSGKSTIQASAFRKVIYKNLYPGIDVEYFFPQGK